MADRLNDRWHSRDFPILLALARASEDGGRLRFDEVAEDLSIRYRDVVASIDLLRTNGYVDCRQVHQDGGSAAVHIRLSERGLRAVGLWPDEDQAAAALIELLTKAADQVDDEDEAGNLRKAGRLLKSVPSSVLADVTAALIRQQTGLP